MSGEAEKEENVSVPADAILEHLEMICKSSFFLSSKRSQEFLRYVVLEFIYGRADQIKERNVALEVFHRGTDFEPGEHSLVRVKATEVRKRLVDYYRSTPDVGFRIEIPFGSYAPKISSTQESTPFNMTSESSEKHTATTLNRRNFAWIAGGALAAVGVSGAIPLFRQHSSPLDLLWRPIFATAKPLLIFVPILGTESVGIGPSLALAHTVEFLTRHHQSYSVRLGSELTYTDLREQPSLLLGGFLVDWTLRMTKDLRFAPLVNEDVTKRAFIDRQTKQSWEPVKSADKITPDVDYGLLCRLFDPALGQIVLLAVGTQTFGTEGAASPLFDSELFEQVIKQAPSNWQTKNFQAVVRVPVIGTTTSSPQVIATHFW